MDYTCDAFFLVIKWWLRMWGFNFFFASCHRSPPAPNGEATRRFGSELQTLPSRWKRDPMHRFSTGAYAPGLTV